MSLFAIEHLGVVDVAIVCELELFDPAIHVRLAEGKESVVGVLTFAFSLIGCQE